MNNNHNIPEIDPEIPKTAVSVYGGDPMDDFPVLKAFQSYIDAEQAKSRKRLMLLGLFFGVLIVLVIAIFVGLLMNAASRNQQLNDRILEYVMKDRTSAPQPSSVVVNPQPDNSAILKLTERLQEMQKKIAESQAAVNEANRAREAAESKAAKPKEPSVEEKEILRLKALLSKEKSAAAEREAAEKARIRELELEVYRRKHYPELYETKKQPVQTPAKRVVQQEKTEQTKTRNVQKKTAKKPLPPPIDELDDIDSKTEEDSILDDSDAIDYFKEETTPSAKKSYSIPVEVRGTSSRWRIPKE